MSPPFDPGWSLLGYWKIPSKEFPLIVGAACGAFGLFVLIVAIIVWRCLYGRSHNINSSYTVHCYEEQTSAEMDKSHAAILKRSQHNWTADDGCKNGPDQPVATNNTNSFHHLPFRQGISPREYSDLQMARKVSQPSFINQRAQAMTSNQRNSVVYCSSQYRDEQAYSRSSLAKPVPKQAPFLNSLPRDCSPSFDSSQDQGKSQIPQLVQILSQLPKSLNSVGNSRPHLSASDRCQPGFAPTLAHSNGPKRISKAGYPELPNDTSGSVSGAFRAEATSYFNGNIGSDSQCLIRPPDQFGSKPPHFNITSNPKHDFVERTRVPSRQTDEDFERHARMTRSLPSSVKNKEKQKTFENSISSNSLVMQAGSNESLDGHFIFTKRCKNRMKNDVAAIIALSRSRSCIPSFVAGGAGEAGGDRETEHLVENETTIVYDERTDL